jgi:hypothetical protein
VIRLFLLFALAVPAVLAQPHAGFLYPAGGQQGTTVEVRVGGQALNGAAKALISGKGVEVRSVEYVKLPNGKETQVMREEMQQLSEKRAVANRPAPAGTVKPVFTSDEQKRLDDLRDKMDAWTRRQFIPSLADTVILQVSIAPDAPLGPRQVRLETGAGLTNPIVFVIGDLPEVTRKASRVGQAYNVVNGGVPVIRQTPKEPDPPTAITIPAVANAQMMPGVTHQYRFKARKGMQLVIAADARELIPYVSDAVPGWFQAAIALRDSKGKVLASADHYLFHPDPLLLCEIPADGEYIAEIHDSIFRGREDFVYRLTVGELPVISSLFPLGARTGTRTSVQTLGWNLPSAKLTEDLKGKPAGLYRVALTRAGLASNTVAFFVDSLPEVNVKPSASVRAKAQHLKLPVIVNGRITHPGEAAFFRFEGAAGQKIVAEVMARRLGSPLDSTLRLTDASGKELAFNDDFEDKSAALLTHQSDSFLSLKLPAKGTYYLQLTDAQHKAGPEYAYRLRISQPRPDYDLRVVPSSFNVRAGSTIPFTVYAVRRDGFSGEIALQLKDAPANFVLSGAAIPPGQDSVRLTLTVPKTPGPQPLSIQLTGKATIDGRAVDRIAVPSEDMEQAFAYHHIVTEDAWLVRVLGNGTTTPWRPLPKPIALHFGQPTPIELPTPYRMDVQLSLKDAPEGITLEKVTAGRDKLNVVLTVQGDKAKPGLKGNLILEAYRDIPANPTTKARRQPMGTLPAVPFEIVQ